MAHRQLERQLKKTGLTKERPPHPPGWDEFLGLVERTYTEADQDRYLLERSLGISSEEMRGLHRQLAAERDTLQTVLNSLTEGVCALDPAGLVILINPQAVRILGVGPGVVGTRLSEAADLRDDQGARIDLSQPTPVGGELRMRVGGAADTFIAYSVIQFPGATGGTVLALRDITQQKHAEQELWRGAYSDKLTGLPNRALFKECLLHELETSRLSKAPFGVLFIDLDRFKLINDSMGHHAGDQVLVAVARRLTASLKASERDQRVTIARLGGDEFVILAREVGPENASGLADRVLNLLASPFVCDGHEMYCNASIGIAIADGSYTRPEDVLRDADIAMYRAKSAGKGRYAVFEASMTEAAVDRLRVESDLRRAIERGEMVLHYQPIIDARQGGLKGFEALVRWRRPEGLVDPGKFIPIAEETGQIIPLGRWVMQEACRQVAAWRRDIPALRGCYVSVNLSTRQFAVPDLVGEVVRTLAASRLDPSALVLEITESAVVDDLDGAVATIHRLRDAGIAVHMDDFGTGYSSLSFLKRLPIQGLKIDRSFVRQMEGNHDGAAIIHAIVTLARSLRMDITAEGVETADQLAGILALDCDRAQGYLFARPLDSACVPAWAAEFAIQRTPAEPPQSAQETRAAA